MKIKSKKLLPTLLFIWSILSGLLLMNFWQKNQKLEGVNSLLLESLISSQQLTKNASAAYKIFGDCVTNQNICNLKDTEAKLQQLNSEKETINERIRTIQLKLQELK